MYSGRDEHRDGIRPGYRRVLTPPSIHHHSHVETQYKRQWYHVPVETTIIYYTFEHPGIEMIVTK